MADIAVSSLIQQIENHIQANRSAKALALCTHILYYFPKHLETYSLMAQALALQGNMDGALEVYRRVLSADPENPGAYAGLAQIFEFRHRLEEAIWHMERAFELTPAQPDIRQELLRLYAQFETEPRVRLKLTRGALARLYAQEGLYDQAIHEFREIGSTSLSRYDVRVALAETLWRAGRTRDAADVAQSLLDSLPYSLKANLILGTAWHESAIAESQKYLERAVSLDPSNQVALKMLGARSPLRVGSVTVPEYVEGAPPPSYAAEPKKSPPAAPLLILPVEDDETLSIFQGQEIKPSVESPTETIIEPASQPSAETAVAEKSEASSTAPSTYAAQEIKPTAINVDLPPWLESDSESIPAPSGESAAMDSRSSGGTPSAEWYAQLRRNFSDPPEEEPGVPAELIPVPDIIEKEPVETPPPFASQEIVQAEPVAEGRVETSDEDVPDWLGGKSSSVVESKSEDRVSAPVIFPVPSAEPSQENIPAWLQSQSDQVVETQQAQSIAPAETAAESQVKPAGENVPAWLSARAEEAQIDEGVLAQLTPPTAITETVKPVEPPPAPVEMKAPLSARADTQETTETRVPKWVEVLSQRDPEKTIAEETPAARLETAAPAASVAEPSIAPTRTEPIAPVASITQPIPPTPSAPIPAVMEYPAPEPAKATPTVNQSTQVAEPEPPIVVELPSASTQVPESPTPKRQPKYFPRLAQAREHRNADHVQDALSEYEFVIAKAPRLVPEVILDLEALVSTGDAPLDAHRLLGDAYTRAGRLNDALERYRYVKRQSEASS